MEDEKIIGLYWERNEDAITETSSKYGKLFFRIASNILLNHEDSEECVNDTYLGLWNAIPKERPSPFSVFASRITRNLALKKYEYLSAEKRKPEAICSFEELGDCVSGEVRYIFWGLTECVSINLWVINLSNRIVNDSVLPGKPKRLRCGHGEFIPSDRRPIQHDFPWGVCAVFGLDVIILRLLLLRFRVT